jgi:peptide deformylase
MAKIISAPDSVLSQKAEKFDFTNDAKNLHVLLSQMEKALLSAQDPKGVGLAAPQIGRSVAIFLCKPTEKSKISVFINPEVINSEEIDKKKLSKEKSASGKRVKKLEGCLSLPNIWGEVLRAPNVTLAYYDKGGKKNVKKFTGFMATIVQHETDHLNGILFPKHVLEQGGKLYKSHKNDKGEDEFEELEI